MFTSLLLQNRFPVMTLWTCSAEQVTPFQPILQPFKGSISEFKLLHDAYTKRNKTWRIRRRTYMNSHVLLNAQLSHTWLRESAILTHGHPCHTSSRSIYCTKARLHDSSANWDIFQINNIAFFLRNILMHSWRLNATPNKELNKLKKDHGSAGL